MPLQSNKHNLVTKSNLKCFLCLRRNMEDCLNCSLPRHSSEVTLLSSLSAPRSVPALKICKRNSPTFLTQACTFYSIFPLSPSLSGCFPFLSPFPQFRFVKLSGAMRQRDNSLSGVKRGKIPNQPEPSCAAGSKTREG